MFLSIFSGLEIDVSGDELVMAPTSLVGSLSARYETETSLHNRFTRNNFNHVDTLAESVWFG